MAQAKIRRMFEVQSNMIHKVGFDPATPGGEHGYLAIQFANFDVYAYENVPYAIALALLNAVSIGEAFNKLIKNEFKGVKLHSERDNHIVNAADVKAPPKKDEDEVPLLDMADAPPSSKKRGKK